VVDGVDGGVGAMPLCLRREAEDDQAGDQATQTGDNGKQPRSLHRLTHRRALTNRAGRQIANDVAEKDMGCELNRPRKGDRANTSDRPNQHAEDKPLAEIAGTLEATTDWREAAHRQPRNVRRRPTPTNDPGHATLFGISQP
jgi:hypothetical protein